MLRLFLGNVIYLVPVRHADYFCLLVIIDVTDHGYKEFVALNDAYQES
ncbi:MAG: hypothetical protein ACTS7E_01930 [Arsenophonus sp. NC-CH8-MAG3]